jgi:hypothetical protein
VEENMVVSVALPPIKRMTEELAELEVPSGKRPRAIVAAFEGAIEEIEAAPSVLSGGDEPFAKSDRLAKQYGFRACSAI